MRAPKRIMVWAAIAAATAAARPAAAGSFEIAPTTIDLPPGGDRLGASDAMSVSPPILRLSPERRQTIRLLIKRGPTATEQSYRLLVSELPDPQSATSQRVRVLLQISVPVFVAAAAPAPPRLTWDAQRTPGGIQLAAHNSGARHAKLVDVFLVTPDGAKIAVAPNAISYVLAGASRHWPVRLPAPTRGAALRVEAHDDGDNAAIGAPVAIAP